MYSYAETSAADAHVAKSSSGAGLVCVCVCVERVVVGLRMGSPWWQNPPSSALSLLNHLLRVGPSPL